MSESVCTILIVFTICLKLELQIYICKCMLVQKSVSPSMGVLTLGTCFPALQDARGTCKNPLQILAGTRGTAGPAAVNTNTQQRQLPVLYNINFQTLENGNCVWTAPKVVGVTVEGVSIFLPRSRIAIQ